MYDFKSWDSGTVKGQEIEDQGSIMAIFLTTEHFDEWHESLNDKTAKRRIQARIEDAEEGNFGYCEAVGEGVIEMKLHFGPGYRLYFYQHGQNEYTLLTGGTKKRQQSDVDRAKSIKRELERGGSW